MEEIMADKRPRVETFIGQRFGRLVIEGVISIEKGGRVRKHFDCICDCGNRSTPLTYTLKSGRATSCGCYGDEVRKKSNALKEYAEDETALSRTPIYHVWQAMKARCRRVTHMSYADYGGRGIDYPDHWEKFLAFYEDMSKGYEPGLELDRKDNNKGYSKENCRWVKKIVNSWNKRKRKGSASKYKGVCFHKQNKNWTAKIKHEGVAYNLGSFEKEVDAAKAYDIKCIELRGDDAYTNQSQYPEDFT